MTFDFSTVSQGFTWVREGQNSLGDKIGDLSAISGWTRFLAAPAAIAATTIQLAEAVAFIGESTIKGLANILGAPFTEECNFFRGLKQIFIKLPCITVMEAICIVAIFPVTFFVTLISPQRFEEFAERNASEPRFITWLEAI